MKIFAIIPLLFASLAFGQSTLLPSSRYDANWPNAGATIPTGPFTNCPTQPSSNTPAAITAAWNADAPYTGGGYCQINVPAGTFNVSGSIILQYSGKANIVLNGAGTNSTFFVWNGAPTTNCVGFGSTTVCVWNGDSSLNQGGSHMANSASVSGSPAQGTTSLILSGHPNLKVGSEIEMVQNDPSSDNGNAWYCQTSGNPGNQCSQQGGAKTPTGTTQTQFVTISACGTSTFGAACTSNTVTITPPIKGPNWNSSQSPTAYWSSSLPIYNVGVQNMSFDVSGITAGFMGQVTQASNVWFDRTRWINGTVNPSAAKTHIDFTASNHATVSNSYFYGANPQSEGYGIDWDSATADSVAFNNITQHSPSAYVTETGVGDVYAYNYAVDNYFGNQFQQCDELDHAGGDTYILFEGNIGTCGGGDDVHGTHFATTFFRNRLSGYDPADQDCVNNGSPTTPPCPKNANVQSYTDMAYSRYGNVIANVFGTAGKNVTYQIAGLSGSPSNCTTAATGNIYQFGYGDQNNRPYNSAACGDSPFGTIDNDPLVAATVMRQGNWDVVNGSVQTNSGEWATSAPVYPGKNPPASTYPAGFYLTSAPLWWVFPSGTVAPFPANGPDVTGGNISGTGGHAWLNPAANCYLNVMHGLTNGSSGPLAFDPNLCYPSGTPGLSPPTYSAGTGNYFVLPTVTITLPAGATGCWTTDGSTPTATTPGTCSHGTIYSSPVPITVSGTTLKSIATQSGHVNSSETDATYTRTNILLDVHSKFDGGSGSVTSGACALGTPQPGDFITAEVTLADGATVISVTDNVNAGNYLLAIAHDNTTIGSRTGIYYKFNVASAPTTVTVTLSGASTFVGMPCEAWKLISAGTVTLDAAFLQQQDQTGAASPNPNTGTALTPSAANELVLSSVITNSLTPGAGTNFTATDFAGGAGIYPQYWIQTTATSTNSPYAMGSDAWTDMQTAFEFTPGGSSAAPSGVSVFVIGIQ